MQIAPQVPRVELDFSIRLHMEKGIYVIKESHKNMCQQAGILEYLEKVIDAAQKVSTFELYSQKVMELEQVVGDTYQCKFITSFLCTYLGIGLPFMIYYCYRGCGGKEKAQKAEPIYDAYQIQVREKIEELELQYPQFESMVQFNQVYSKWQVKENGVRFRHLYGEIQVNNKDKYDPDMAALQEALRNV